MSSRRFHKTQIYSCFVTAKYFETELYVEKWIEM